MSDLDTFRTETRAWLDANCPLEMRQPVLNDDDRCWGGRNRSFQSPEQKLWLDRMAERGWTAPEWPKAYGGGGLSPAEAKVLRQEMAALRCRPPLASFGLWMLGPALLKYGTEEQKKHYLPQITLGQIRWCQGYSEPGAGSDLASLQTKAEDKGDHFLINGQKIWTSYADKADWIFCLVRTDPTASKHNGISFLLFDMATPGVSTKPIVLISGRSPFCETFFDDVKAPKDQIVGDLNRGWDVAKYLLGHERDMISNVGAAEGEPLAAVAVRTLGLEDGKLADPILRADIARYDVDAAAFGMMLERASDMAKAGQFNPAYASALKYYGSELNKRRHEIAMSAGGADNLEWESQRSNDGYAARSWLRTKGNSIEGGTSEVMLGIVAKRILNLPGA
ncbi:MAG: acyl-CoA dehydrogenase family protein [Caulobacteraceae bacterium]